MSTQKLTSITLALVMLAFAVRQVNVDNRLDAVEEQASWLMRNAALSVAPVYTESTGWHRVPVACEACGGTGRRP